MVDDVAIAIKEAREIGAKRAEEMMRAASLGYIVRAPEDDDPSLGLEERLMTDFLSILSYLADQAQKHGRPLPIIETDIFTACKIARIIEVEGGFRLMPGDALLDGAIAIYNGIRIVARRPEICQHEVDGWRDHFGVLADIWA